jgi:AcrR family transcriptional regulator
VARPALRQDQIDAFRDRLCDVATRRFAEQGVAGVTLRALARDLGCSPTRPYRYFRDKEEIFAAVRARAFARLAQATSRAAAREQGSVMRLRVAGRAYLQFARREPHAYRICFELDQPDSTAYPELQKQRAEAWQVLRDAVEEALRSGDLEGDVDELAHLFWAGLHGLAALDVAGQLTQRSFARLVEPMIETLLRGSSAASARGVA